MLEELSDCEDQSRAFEKKQSKMKKIKENIGFVKRNKNGFILTTPVSL